MCPDCHDHRTDDRDASVVAHATQRWRCTACAKVSEGFAFPYGACPLCGAALEPFEPVPVADPIARHAVRKAFEIELGGQAFYHRAAAITNDESLRALFGRFAAMERAHMDALARRYHVDFTQVYDAYAIDCAAMFAGVPRRVGGADELFAIAIGMEQRAAEFFETSAQAMPTASPGRALYRELAAEEREHVALLRAEWERFRAGKPALLRSESAALEAAARDTATTINAAAIMLAQHAAQRVALVCGDAQLSYGDLRERVARAAAAWRLRGLQRGDRVAVKLADGIDWVVAYFGVIWAGGVAVGVNPRVPEPEWAAILDSAGFRFILVDAVDDTPAPWNASTVVLDAWRRMAAATPPCAAVPMRPEEPALWVHSSGTSGRPKAVVHPHRIALEIERVGRERLGVTADDRLYASSKLFFAHALANSLFTGLKLGATVILDPQWPTAQNVAATASASRATVLLSVPSLFRNLLKEGFAARLSHAGVRLCVSAGETLPAGLRDAWKREGGPTIVNGFGVSETLVLALVDRGDGEDFRPSPGFDVTPLALEGTDASDADVDPPHRILIRGSTVGLGYWNRPDAQAEHFRDGGFSPSDLFHRDARGGFTFAGREDSLVKVRGRWVDLVELEQRLTLACPAIGEAAAVTVHDDDGVDAVALFFVACAGSTMLGQVELRDHANQLAPHQRPQWLHQLEALPRTPTGKLLRRRLRDLHYAMTEQEKSFAREEARDAGA